MNELKQNKMGTMPVGKLLFSMAAPMILSMLVQALYNVVDSIYIAHYDPNALAALTYAFPMQNLLIGSATGMAVGLNAVLSRSLGQGDRDRVNAAAANGVFMAGVTYAVFLMIGLFLARPFIAMQTDTPEVIEAGAEYLSVVCCFSFGMYIQIVFERIMQSTGRTIYTLFTQGTGALINIILDPFFIFSGGDEMFGFSMPFGLGLGAKGAAIATVIGQVIAAALAVTFNLLKNNDVHFSFRGFRPDGKMIGRIYSVGIPSMLMMGIGSIMTGGMNIILSRRFSDMAASVFGVYFKLQSFVFMPTFGLNNGAVPIIAFNWGAGNRKRMLRTVRIAAYAVVSYMLLGCLTMQCFPGTLLKLFRADESMLAIGIPALRTISLSFLLAGLSVVSIAVFNAMGKGIYAMLVSMCRQLVVLLPCAYLFSLSGVVSRVWWSFPLAELMSFALCTVFFIRLYRSIISKVPEGVW